MVNFGEILQSQAHPAWRVQYFDYDKFKGLIKDPSANFSDLLVAEVGRVDAFAKAQRREAAAQIALLEGQWQNVLRWEQSGFPDIMTQVEPIHQALSNQTETLELLLDYITLNVTAIKKICKKHDRTSGQNSGPVILTRLQRDVEAAYLEELSNMDELEKIVLRTKALLTEVARFRQPKSKRVLIPADIDDHYSIPVTRLPSASPSASSSSSSGGNRGSSGLVEISGPSFADLLALPLLVPHEESVLVPSLTVCIALVGPLLAGAIVGAFLNSLQAIAPQDQTVGRILVFSLGSLTGSWPASKYSMTLLAFAGCLGSFLLHSTVFVYIGCWLLGVGVGAWISKFPRQLAVGTSKTTRASVAVASLVGMLLGAMFTPRVVEPQLAMAWFIFTLLVLMHERQVQLIVDSDVETGGGGGEVKDSHTAAAQAMIWASLASLGLVRWGRSLLVFTVVCYGGPRIITLVIASILAAPTAVFVPAWMCAMLSCVAVVVLQDPSAMAWFWADAATRADLALIPKEWASTTDSVMATADAFAGFTLFVAYMSQVPNPATGLAVFSGVLLASASLGRVVADRL